MEVVLMTDKFPEAFERFEESVDLDDIQTLPELISQFKEWGGKRATMTRKQTRALAISGEDKLGIKGAEQVVIEYDITLKSGELKHIIRVQWRDYKTGTWTEKPDWS
jgi:hypothetical protein